MDKVLVICGATASGKTKLAVDCAEMLNTEIISADSQQIYKKLNIGTAKPTKEEMRGIKHHLIDVAEPCGNFSVSDFVEMAEPIIQDLQSKGKIPIICGGTGFYINSLLYDLSYGNVAADETIREKYAAVFKDKGGEYLHSLLRNVDPETAQKLHPNDVKRVIRALEIYEVGGKRKSEISDYSSPRRNYVAVAINYPREELYDRINRRVDEMFECGLVEEVERLLESGVDENCQCMQAIGYKEVVQGFKNKEKRSTMCDIIKQNTRRYAKRQITFFKKLKNLVWLDPEEATCERVMELINGN